ncbi:MAG: ATP-binding protein [Anaerolineales bacterium]
MSAISLLLLLLLLLISWQYLRLHRRVKEYAAHLRRDRPEVPAWVSGLEDLSAAIHALFLSLQEQLQQEREERARLTMLLEQLSDAVLLVDENGLVTFLNPAAERLFQVSSQLALGHPVDEVLRYHRLIETWRLSRERHEAYSEWIEWPRRRLFLHCIVVPDRYRSGGSLLLIQDLTRLHQLETMRRDFVTNFSHEIRTPLTTIQALAETLRGGALEDASVAHQFLEQIEHQVQALTRLAEGLLELSQLESGTVPIKVQPVEVLSLLERVAERLRWQIEQAGLSLILECVALPPVLADPLRLEQVLINLLQNAIRFSPPGKRIWVSAVYESESERIHFSVRDEGKGIPEEHLPRIFERFYKADASEGHGLGLAIARHIIEAHNGRIWVESTLGKGTTFHFILPAASQVELE